MYKINTYCRERKKARKKERQKHSIQQKCRERKKER